MQAENEEATYVPEGLKQFTGTAEVLYSEYTIQLLH